LKGTLQIAEYRMSCCIYIVYNELTAIKMVKAMKAAGHTWLH